MAPCVAFALFERFEDESFFFFVYAAQRTDAFIMCRMLKIG